MLGDWIKLARLSNALVAGCGVLLGHACMPNPINWTWALLGSFSLALLAIAGNMQNDVLDLQVDRINRPHRPLASGKLPVKQARIGFWTLYAASIALAFGLTLGLGFLTLAMALLLFGYNAKFKSLPLWGNLSVALLCALAIYYPEFPGLPVQTGLPALFAFLTTLIREIAKDAEDIPGDSAVGWKTFPIRFGLKATRKILGLLSVVVLGLLPLPMIWLGYHWSYGVAILVGPLPLLLGILPRLGQEKPNWSLIQKHLKGIMVAGMAAVLLGINI